jgi:DivIVA domain-containing protein
MRIDEIVSKAFTRSFMGYDIEQVDQFLDEIIDTLERYEQEKREMLSAMEYLMKKLERGQKVPLSDMKKAIDSERSAERPQLPEGEQPQEEEQRASARSIARGNGAGKSMRAPKVNRMKREDDVASKIIEEAKSVIPQQELTPEEADKRAKRLSSAAANWLDELLINIAEHETFDYDKPLTSAQQPQAPQAQETTASEPVIEQTQKTESQPETAAQPPEQK